MGKVNEILTCEIYFSNEHYEIHVPVHNLMSPKFLLKEDSLYIFLYDYKVVYVLFNIPKKIIPYIKQESVFLCEAMSQNKSRHKIQFMP
ncbi:hypothetical protein GW796_10450 [archaeon]|nr:hypothetical protein [archaeon]